MAQHRAVLYLLASTLTTPFLRTSASFTRLGRLGSFCLFVVGLIWLAIARLLANRAAHGLSAGDWVDLVEWGALVFLLLVGYVAMGRSFSGQARPLAAMGLPRRSGRGREFAVGAAAGWALLLLAVLPSAFLGGLRITFWTAPHQWFLLLLDGIVLLLAALSEELVFRGYPFQRLIDAIGPGLATLLMSAIFTAYHYNADTPRPAILVLFLLGCILSLAYLRTRALWLPWALHFAWNASMGLLFGLADQRVHAFFTSGAELCAGADRLYWRGLWTGRQRLYRLCPAVWALAGPSRHARIRSPLCAAGDRSRGHSRGPGRDSPSAA